MLDDRILVQHQGEVFLKLAVHLKQPGRQIFQGVGDMGQGKLLFQHTAGHGQFGCPFSQNLRRISLDQLAKGSGQGETQSGIYARVFLTDGQSGGQFANDSSEFHQLR